MALEGHLGGQPIALGLHSESEPLEVLDAELGLDRHPEQSLGLARPQPHAVRRWDLGGDVDRPRHQPRPAQLDHQPRGDSLGTHRELGVKLLLEAVGGV